MEACPLKDGHTYNLKYELAEYFIQKAKETGQKLSIQTNLFAYDCPKSIVPAVIADGGLYTCTMEDVEQATDFLLSFGRELDNHGEDAAQKREKAIECIGDNRFFFWKDASGKVVASCYFNLSDGLACLAGVYTLPEHRRKHYAQNLVYKVSELTRAKGYLPMLYTDADYAASNACYTQVGYQLKGKLCTLG
jgi:predicted GNAT family acetyltransferase